MSFWNYTDHQNLYNIWLFSSFTTFFALGIYYGLVVDIYHLEEIIPLSRENCMGRNHYKSSSGMHIVIESSDMVQILTPL